jgi:hypothetical protein
MIAPPSAAVPLCRGGTVQVSVQVAPPNVPGQLAAAVADWCYSRRHDKPLRNPVHDGATQRKVDLPLTGKGME